MDLEKALERILDLEQTNKEMNDQCESLKVENESFKSKIEEQQKRNANWVFSEPNTVRSFVDDENNVFGSSGVW